MVQQLLLGKPFGEHPASDVVLLIIGVIFGFAFPIFFYMTNLAIEIRDDGLYIRFFPFHLSFRRISLEDLKRYEVRTYSALKEYGGWGIRYGPAGKAYNVSGNQVVQLELLNGQKLLLGSRRAQELAASIDSALGSTILSSIRSGR